MWTNGNQHQLEAVCERFESTLMDFLVGRTMILCNRRAAASNGILGHWNLGNGAPNAEAMRWQGPRDLHITAALDRIGLCAGVELIFWGQIINGTS